MSIPFFGNAVHAVLPFLAQGGDPFTLSYPAFVSALHKHMVQPFKFYDDEAYRRIRGAWEYVAEIVALADEVWIEPVLPNGKCPDIVLTHGGRLYVIDIKTEDAIALRLMKLKNKHNRKMQIQIQESLCSIRYSMRERIYGYGYALVISSRRDTSGEPAWKLVHEIAI